MPNLLEKREAYMPFEYPAFIKFADAIQDTSWTHRELDFIRDVQDYKVKLTDLERFIIQQVMVSFVQTELIVGDDFYLMAMKHIPKPEWEEVCVVIAENEKRHTRAYARLNEVLGIDNFDEFLKDEVVMERFDALIGANELKNDHVPLEKFMEKLAIFSAFTEGVALFSQFAIMLSFSQRNLLNDLGNVIAWSQRDETTHMKTGIYLLNLLFLENPHITRESMFPIIKKAADLTLEIETKLVKKIFSQGDLVNLTLEQLINYMKYRINHVMELMGFDSLHEVDDVLLEQMSWFTDESVALEQTDFFAGRPVEYTKDQTDYSADSLF